MKKLILLFVLPFLGFSQGQRQGETRGFKDYVFGTPPESYKNLTLEIEEGNTRLYSLNEPGLVIDGVAVEYMRFTFTKNKLSDIALQSKNSTGVRLLQNLRDTYGEPTRISKSKKSYEWLNDKMQLLYEGNMTGNDATVTFSSKAIK